jgi:hypothetical protein
VFQQIFASGFDAGLNCRDSFARKLVLAGRVEAAELIELIASAGTRGEEAPFKK